MLIKNAQLHKEIDAHASIKDLYYTELKKYTANRRKDGRKIVSRKTKAELKLDKCCPYKSCSKIYASE